VGLCHDTAFAVRYIVVQKGYGQLLHSICELAHSYIYNDRRHYRHHYLGFQIRDMFAAQVINFFLHGEEDLSRCTTHIDMK
jgi:hypothetical protein